MFEHAKNDAASPVINLRPASTSSGATLISGIQLVAAHRHLSATFCEANSLLLRANRRSPAFRPAMPRRHVVQTPSIVFYSHEASFGSSPAMWDR